MILLLVKRQELALSEYGKTVEEDNSCSDGLKNFAAFVFHKLTQETIAADDFSMMSEPAEEDL